jgi:hypothetical protein
VEVFIIFGYVTRNRMHNPIIRNLNDQTKFITLIIAPFKSN